MAILFLASRLGFYRVSSFSFCLGKMPICPPGSTCPQVLPNNCQPILNFISDIIFFLFVLYLVIFVIYKLLKVFRHTN